MFLFQYKSATPPQTDNRASAMSDTASPASNSSTSSSPHIAFHSSLLCESTDVKRTQKRRAKLPKEATEYLKDWLHCHADHPYPSEEEKRQMCARTGLTMSQVSNWMINARRRILAPLQNAENSSPSHAVEADHVPLLPPNDGDATLLLHGLPSMPLDDLDSFFSSPTPALPVHTSSIEPQAHYAPQQQLLHAAYSSSAPVYPTNAAQRVFPGYAFTQSSPQARAAYAISAMQAERTQRGIGHTPTAFPYW